MKAILFAVLALFCLGTATAHAASPAHPACVTAYDDARAGKLAEAAAKMTECGAATDKPTPGHTVVLYDRARLLDKLGRHDEALAQLVALTDKTHFETGLADEFSGPGAWSRDPDKTRVRQATGLNRADLLLDIAWRKLRAKDYPAAMDWAERSARHALTRYRPDGEFFPNDRDAGCALALRGFARFEAAPDDATPAWADLARGYIRGCEKLPVAAEIGRLSDDNRKAINALKQRFETLQAEARMATEQVRQTQREAAAKPAGADLGALGLSMLTGITARQKAVEPVLRLRTEFLAAETRAFGREPLLEIEARP